MKSLKNIHHSWIFWIFLFLALICIGFYVLSLDFSLVPDMQAVEPNVQYIEPKVGS